MILHIHKINNLSFFKFLFLFIFCGFLFGQEIENRVSTKAELQVGLKGMLKLLQTGKKDSAGVWFKNNYYLLNQYNLLTDSTIISLYNERNTDKKFSDETQDTTSVVTPELHTFIINELKQVAIRLGEPPEQILPGDFVREVEKYINLFSKNETYRSFFQKALNRSQKFMPAFKHFFIEKGFPEEILYFVIIESGFNTNAVSKAGAAGMFQFMTGTARDYGLRVDERTDERFSAVKSARASAAYLKDLYLELGSISLALCSYNSGASKTRNALKELENVNDRNFWILREKSSLLKEETREYIPQIFASIIMAKPENLTKFGFRAYSPPQDSTFAVFYLPKPVNVNMLSSGTGIPVKTIYTLNNDLAQNQEFTPADINDYPLFIPASEKERVRLYLTGLLGNNQFDGLDASSVKAYSEKKPIKEKPEKKKPTYNPENIQSAETFNIGDSFYYDVQRANTLHMVARIFKVNSDSVMVWNGLKFRSLKKDQKLKINPTQKITRYLYKVPENSSFKNIAEQFNVDYDNLKKTNRSKSEFLSKGDILVVYSF